MLGALIVFTIYTLIALLAYCNVIAAGWYEATRGSEHIPPCSKYLLGTDFLGRSVLKKMIKATQTAVAIGTLVGFLATLLGFLLGCIAGYFGGWIDKIIVWFCSVINTMPDLMLLISIGLVFEKSMLGLYIGLITVNWAKFCLVIRAQTMQECVKSYVQAATTLGASHFRKIFVHILPNVIHTAIIQFAIIFQGAIKTEVVLAHLGIGVSTEMPSWGKMISEAKTELLSHGHWWEVTFATLALAGIVITMNLLSGSLRDITDPKLKRNEKPS